MVNSPMYLPTHLLRAAHVCAIEQLSSGRAEPYQAPELARPYKRWFTKFIRSGHQEQQTRPLQLDSLRRRVGGMSCIRSGGCQPLSVRTDLDSAPLPRTRRVYQSQSFNLHPKMVRSFVVVSPSSRRLSSGRQARISRDSSASTATSSS